MEVRAGHRRHCWRNSLMPFAAPGPKPRDQVEKMRATNAAKRATMLAARQARQKAERAPPEPTPPPLCCWPVGTPGGPDAGFCMAIAELGHPHCAAHVMAAFRGIGR